MIGKMELPGGFRVSRVDSRWWKMLGRIGWWAAVCWWTTSKLFTWTVLMPGSVLLPNPTSHSIFNFAGGEHFSDQPNLGVKAKTFSSSSLQIWPPPNSSLIFKKNYPILSVLSFSENSLVTTFCGSLVCWILSQIIDSAGTLAPPGLSVNILYFVSDPISDKSYKPAAPPAHEGCWQ